MIATILKLLERIAAAFTAWLETYNARTLERLDKEADQLRNLARAAADRGEHDVVLRHQQSLNANRIRAKAIRDAAKPQGGEGR